MRFAICNWQFLVLPVVIVFALALPGRGEPIKLEWGRERSAAKPSVSTPTTLRFVKPGVAPVATAPASRKPSTKSKSSGAVIQLVAYEGNAPRLTSGRETEAETRSVVVNREGESPDGFRAAQLPAAGAGETKDPSGSSNSGVADGLRSPFTDNPAEPPQPNPLPMPESTAAPALPPPANNMPAVLPSEPAAPPSQPAQAPSEQPNAGQFQPVLPSGPDAPEQTPTPTPAASEKAIEEEGTKARESCDKSLQNLRDYTVDKVSLNIAIGGTEGKDFPFECSIDDGSMHAGRCWDQTTYMWKASAMCHKPLYFEDEQLERYGHSFTPCLQPFVSGAHFFTRLPVLPYCMGVEPPCECIYALGHYRPGSCAPYMCNPIPLSLRGALFEAGAVVGTAAVLP